MGYGVKLGYSRKADELKADVFFAVALNDVAAAGASKAGETTCLGKHHKRTGKGHFSHDMNGVLVGVLLYLA